MKSINDLFEVRKNDEYQRDNFDYFLEKIKFKYDIPSIHVAGSNGKGSVCYYLSNIYQAAGYKVGRFISPHLVEINESISVNGNQISDEDIKRIIKDELKMINKAELSYFEVLTYVALTYFQEQKCDIAIIECGMGGELDATNIFTPVLSIITSVSLEHTSYLGRSISEIAEHKAGIIKDYAPVLIGQLDEDAVSVIADIAKDKHSKLYSISPISKIIPIEDGTMFEYLTFGELKIPSLADYSVIDACFALDATKILEDMFPVNSEQRQDGLLRTIIPCRFDKVHDNPTVIIDGAHNPESMKKFMESVSKRYSGRHISVVFACFKDKNLNTMISHIGEVANEIILTTFPHVRARNKEDYFLYADEYEFIDNSFDAFKKAYNEENRDVIIITGSLAFAGYMKENYEVISKDE